MQVTFWLKSLAKFDSSNNQTSLYYHLHAYTCPQLWLKEQIADARS